jgi:hypothetical protein
MMILVLQEGQRRKKMAKKWIQAIGMKKGALHQQLGIPQDEKIPKSTLEAAAKQGGKLGKRARLALTLSGMHKKSAHGSGEFSQADIKQGYKKVG